MHVPVGAKEVEGSSQSWTEPAVTEDLRVRVGRDGKGRGFSVRYAHLRSVARARKEVADPTCQGSAHGLAVKRIAVGGPARDHDLALCIDTIKKPVGCEIIGERGHECERVQRAAGRKAARDR